MHIKIAEIISLIDSPVGLANKQSVLFSKIEAFIKAYKLDNQIKNNGANATSSKTYQFITNILQFLSFALYSLIKTHNYKFWNTRSERLIENTNALLLENNQIITATT